MRLCIYDQFIVGVVRPKGGWSKGRTIAYIEEDDRCVPLTGLLIPNTLDEEAMARYVGDRFRAFSLPGKRVVALTHDPDETRSAKRRGVARSSALAGVQQ
jgi:hypothetical protein